MGGIETMRFLQVESERDSNMHRILDVIDITKTYPGVVALDAVSFDLYRGETHCIVGENGAGKSTLIKILSGAERPDSGEIRLFDQSFPVLDPNTARELGIQTIYQESNLVEILSVAENIFFGDERANRLGFFSHRQTEEQTRELLDSLKIEIEVNRLVSELSISEKQLIKIAKGLARNATILIMDEPTASLNQSETDRLLQLINEIKSSGIGVIYISHRLGEVFKIADRISVLRDGKKIDTHHTPDIDENNLILEMVGKRGNVFYTREAGSPEEVVLQVHGYKIREDRHEINFTLRRGEILGVAGMVGSGRSELMKGLFGAEPLHRGSLSLNNAAFEILSPRDAIDAGICLVPEDRQSEGLILCRSVRENTTLPGLKRFKGFFINLIRELEIVTELVSKLNIKTPSAEQKVQNLSGGNQQKTVLAKWLFTDAQILIFDEPTRGIDVGAKQEIYRLMGDLVKQGKSIIMISSDMPELLAMSDRIMVLRNSEVAGFLEKEQITEESILSLAIGSARVSGPA
jgi:ribose transport system ATP-binding protein